MKVLKNNRIVCTSILAILLNTSCFQHKDTTTHEHADSSIETHSKIDSTILLKPSNGIRSILEDRMGNFWFGSTEWTCFFDGTSYTYFTEEDGLCFKDSRIQEDKNGIIWIQSGKNLARFNGEKFSFFALDQNISSDTWDVAEDDLWFHRGMERDENWIGKPGAYRLRDGEFNYLNFPVASTENNDQLYLVSSGPKIGKDGTLWFGSMEALIGYKNDEFTFIGRSEMGRNNDPRNIGIRDIYEDSKGRIWLADNGSGLFVYDGITTVNFTKTHNLDQDDRNGNTLHRTFSVMEDNDGNMWFGTVYSGIWKYDGNSFKNYSKKEGVVSENIWTIYKTKNGDLLFAGEKNFPL